MKSPLQTAAFLLRKRKGSPESMSSSSSSPPTQGSLPLAQAHGGDEEVLPPTPLSRGIVGSVIGYVRGMMEVVVVVLEEKMTRSSANTPNRHHHHHHHHHH